MWQSLPHIILVATVLPPIKFHVSTCQLLGNQLFGTNYPTKLGVKTTVKPMAISGLPGDTRLPGKSPSKTGNKKGESAT